MKKKTMACVLILSLIMSLGLWNLSYADELQDQMDEVTQEKEDIAAEMSELKGQIEAAQEEVDAIQVDIDAKQDEIRTAEAEIEQTKKEIRERQEGLDNRLRAMYKNGSVGYLDVLLGSSSISEFLNNIEMIQRIYRNDQEILVQLEEEHDLLEKKQFTLEEQKAGLDEQHIAIQEKQDKLKSSQEKLQEKLDGLNAQADAISAEIVARQKALEEKRKQEAAANNNNNAGESGGGGNSSGSGGYDGGALMWPCDSTIITSEFGYRIHPLTGIYTGHTGIDIGCSMNSPIYAAESGTVILSEWYGGYGYAVVIDHGNGISTLYGHNDYLIAEVGDEVNRGDVIASSGNTGWSTGPHLHFEVRINGEYVDPMNYF